MPLNSSPKYELTAIELRNILHYDPTSGIFTWLISTGKAINGARAGQLRKNGYRRIIINGYTHSEAQLAWLYMTGEWSTLMMDHKNRIRNDNRWDNLRQALPVQQNINRSVMKNNTSGVTGVSKGKGNHWRVKIRRYGKTVRLGGYNSFEAAVKVRKTAEEKDGEWRVNNEGEIK